ncbi:MAG: hypothetical protein M3454_08380 [Actinomycetota bacterium]|nr:hypothetical protein [Actinomycetota bacterium]
MSVSPEPLPTRDSMSAAEYQDASWQAYKLGMPPPHPASLSDHTLYAFLNYEGPDLLLPSAARQAVEAESLRRGASPVFVDEVTGLVMMAGLSVGGVVIGLGLLVS